MGVSGQRHAPAALYPGERTPGTHCTGGWVGPRAGLDAEARREKSSAPVGDRTPIVQPIVRHYTDSATPAPTSSLKYRYMLTKTHLHPSNKTLQRHERKMNNCILLLCLYRALLLRNQIRICSLSLNWFSLEENVCNINCTNTACYTSFSSHPQRSISFHNTQQTLTQKTAHP
jgi:hypothetical protein